jgi:tRNA threonylcarbamoyladenosine biosynthesis protein TsaE
MSNKMEQVTHSEEETIAFAKQFGKTLKPGTVIALHGNLGAGKTTFIKGLALGLGLKDADEVKSPTFALMHTYEARIPIYHFDLYRLETTGEIANIGFEEFVNDARAITCVEWGERAKDLLPAHIAVELEAKGPTERHIRIKAGLA